MVLAPLHAVAAAEILNRTLTYVKQVLDNLVRAHQVDGTVRVGEAQLLFLVQVICVAGFVVFHIAAGGLIRQPLADVTLVGPGLLRQLLR